MTRVRYSPWGSIVVAAIGLLAGSSAMSAQAPRTATTRGVWIEVRELFERVQRVLRVAVNGTPMEWGFDLNRIDPEGSPAWRSPRGRPRYPRGIRLRRATGIAG
jgi:hypothetical protein